MSSKQKEALNQLLGLIDNEILVFNDGLDASERRGEMSSKLREALKMARRFVYASAQTMGRDILVYDRCGKPYILTPQYALREIDAALAEPLRNCDVGTAEEQIKRFRASCEYLKARPPKTSACLDCPVNKQRLKGTDSACTLIWSQMPYKKEGEE